MKEHLRDSFEHGVLGVRVWKEIGVEIKDPAGEYVVDGAAKRLDRYPNFAVGIDGRTRYFMAWACDKVRKFLIKYHNRILYGTDRFAGAFSRDVKLATGREIESSLRSILDRHRHFCRYYATDDEMRTITTRSEVQRCHGKFCRRHTMTMSSDGCREQRKRLRTEGAVLRVSVRIGRIPSRRSTGHTRVGAEEI